jgi:hypothetical protein
MNKRKYLYLSILTMILITTTSIGVALAGTGSIRIDPPLPDPSITPAVFEVWVQGTDNATDPHVFLVLTETCGQSSPVANVSWDGGFIVLSSWTMENTNGDKVPPGATNGAGYTVASLKDHLDTSGAIYWSMAPIFDGPIVPGVNQTLTVAIDCVDPEMLVYIMGKSPGSSMLNMRVPPTIPGFVIPEIPLGSVTAIITMLSSAGLYLRKRK